MHGTLVTYFSLLISLLLSVLACTSCSVGTFSALVHRCAVNVCVAFCWFQTTTKTTNTTTKRFIFPLRHQPTTEGQALPLLIIRRNRLRPLATTVSYPTIHAVLLTLIPYSADARMTPNQPGRLLTFSMSLCQSAAHAHCLPYAPQRSSYWNEASHHRVKEVRIPVTYTIT